MWCGQKITKSNSHALSVEMDNEAPSHMRLIAECLDRKPYLAWDPLQPCGGASAGASFPGGKSPEAEREPAHFVFKAHTPSSPSPARVLTARTVLSATTVMLVSCLGVWEMAGNEDRGRWL